MTYSCSAKPRTMIRIYPTFTEIREDIEAKSPHVVYIPEDLYEKIKPDSLNLENVNLQNMDTVLRENNLEGKVIHILKNNELRKVKMIRSSDSLVQDLQTNRYFRVDKSQIEFSEIPEETGTEVTFIFDKNGPAVLSYLMFGIKWNPRYILNINGDSCNLQGWADIKNKTIKKYFIDRTELLGGDVNITPYHKHDRYRNIACKSARREPVEMESEGEVSGLYMYTIKKAYILSPNSTFSLPFASPKIEFQKLAKMTSHFSESIKIGISERVYKIKSNEFLPGGNVIVREDGRVVGESLIENLSAEEKADLSVGNDSEIFYERESRTIFNDKEMSKHEITIKIKSKKNHSINYEFSEHFYGRYQIKADSEKLKIENDYIKTEGSIDPNGEQFIKFNVVFYYN
ncbi:unnamed protein product [Brachionus calyciflorus]|uniref:DUF4139 domain-containing protein n=1 Tax=Brachionus calyciflorus TaxID=104777 RepID=A0A813T896_9BILA|nr:unnamed protein product [Brachionus calyciflorus]